MVTRPRIEKGEKKIKKKKEGEDREEAVGNGVELRRFAETSNLLLGTRQQIP